MKKIILPVIMGVGIFTLSGCVETDEAIDIASMITTSLESEVIYETNVTDGGYILKSDDMIATKTVASTLEYFDYIAKEDNMFYKYGVLGDGGALEDYKYPVDQAAFDKLDLESQTYLEVIDGSSNISFVGADYELVDENNHAFEVSDGSGGTITYTFTVEDEIITALKGKTLGSERSYTYKYGNDVPTIDAPSVDGDLIVFDNVNTLTGEELALDILTYLEGLDDTLSIRILEDMWLNEGEIKITMETEADPDDNHYFTSYELFSDFMYFGGTMDTGHLTLETLVSSVDILIQYA